IGNGDVVTTAVASGEEALTSLQSEQFDCMVLDLKLPDMTGFELIEKIQTDLGQQQLPIIIYTGKELTEKEETQLRKVTDAIIVKEASSPERLLAETALFLHRVEANLPEPKRRMLEQLHRRDPVLARKKVLIVDDDVRNIFALTSALESHNMEVTHAENGQDAIELLRRTPDVDVVLMDIMMPGMDGYETMRAVRKISRFQSLPIIALTAKAMKADRDRCIEAGASDYISKPLDVDQLLSLLRVWLYRQEESRG
ncbi:MAG: response regulator, partial [Pyrinomonadaceae bacterium]|nr:response regulator [Pyrinomonadaceae bacterium]